MSNTPETDDFFFRVDIDWDMEVEFARRLERERDEARELHTKALREREATEKEVYAMLERAQKAERERDEAMEMLENWEDSAAHVEEDYPDEVHCGCVPVLRKLLHDARRERDEAINTIRETLEENRHLADGDDCTLRKLKQLVRDNSHDKVSRDGALD